MGLQALMRRLGLIGRRQLLRNSVRRFVRKYKSVSKKKEPVSIDVQHKHGMENREWCNLTMSPVFDEKGEMKYFVSFSDLDLKVCENLLSGKVYS